MRCATPAWDPRRPLWSLRFERTPAQLLTSDQQVLSGFERRFHLALCAELLGFAEARSEMTANYLKEREQFGVPIGSFQAVSQSALRMLYCA